MNRFAVVVAVIASTGCAVRTLGQHDPGVDIARVMAETNRDTAKAIAEAQTAGLRAMVDAFVATAAVRGQSFALPEVQGCAVPEQKIEAKPMTFLSPLDPCAGDHPAARSLACAAKLSRLLGVK